MDIQFSGAEVAVIIALMTAVTTPLTLMFRMLMAEKDARIRRLEEQNDQLLSLAMTGTKAVESATTVLKTTRGSR